jgi:prevent-host-death family protein
MKSTGKRIGSFGAKTHLSSLLEDVQKGSEYVITRRGKPVARLVPFTEVDTSLTPDEVILQFDSIRNSVKGNVDIKDYISTGRKR